MNTLDNNIPEQILRYNIKFYTEDKKYPYTIRINKKIQWQN